MTDDERLERERRYHDARYEHETRGRVDKYYETAAASSTAYNSLLSVNAGDHVLEYGCGTGSAAFELAALGAHVTGIDISPVAIDTARATATERGLTTAEFRLMNAEVLDVEDSSYDLVCGSGVLHHLDLSRAYPEVARVLRPQGRAAFFEPMGHNPVINLYRRLTPSLRTPDEHPLLMSDFDLARRWFDSVESEFFTLLTLLVTPLRGSSLGGRFRSGLGRADRWLFEHSRLAQRWAWTVVLDLRRPRRTAEGP